MGLDLVEFVMAVEDRFGIELSDDEAMHSETPSKLIDLIYSKVGQGSSKSCLTSRVFYSVRKALMQQFEWNRSQVVPGAPLEQLIPRPCRRVHWLRLRDILHAKHWVRLKRPSWLVWTIAVVCGALVASLKLGNEGISLWITLPALFAFWLFVLLLTRPLCLEIPPNLATVGDLTRYLLAYAPELSGSKIRPWSRADVATAIRELTVIELGVDPGDYREDAHFVKDLHAS